MPATKRAGDTVIGATINTTGSLRVRAEKVGADTMLAQIIKMVQQAQAQAQASRAPIQRLADAVSGYFVPAVIAVAIATFAIWFTAGPAPAFTLALVSAIAVLIIACPCALGLATPLSIQVGTGKGARAGILIRSAESLETAHKLDTIVLDKTGTITAGRPALTDVRPAGRWSEGELLAAFALAYNGIGIPVAAGILYPLLGIRLSPIIAAAAMALSSLSVVTNANRLRRYHPAPLPPAGQVHGEPRVETPGARAGSDETAAGPVTDPVCGMTVDPAAAPEHRGAGPGTVYFCSPGCAAAFDAEHHATRRSQLPGNRDRAAPVSVAREALQGFRPDGRVPSRRFRCRPSTSSSPSVLARPPRPRRGQRVSSSMTCRAPPAARTAPVRLTSHPAHRRSGPGHVRAHARPRSRAGHLVHVHVDHRVEVGPHLADHGRPLLRGQRGVRVDAADHGGQDRVLETGHRLAVRLGDIGERGARVQLRAELGQAQAEVVRGGRHDRLLAGPHAVHAAAVPGARSIRRRRRGRRGEGWGRARRGEGHASAGERGGHQPGRGKPAYHMLSV
jgi:YHS domain-containing protein